MAGFSGKAIILLVIGVTIAAGAIPAAVNTWEAVNTSTWSTGTAAIWGVGALIIVGVTIFHFAKGLGRR